METVQKRERAREGGVERVMTLWLIGVFLLKPSGDWEREGREKEGEVDRKREEAQRLNLIITFERGFKGKDFCFFLFIRLSLLCSRRLSVYFSPSPSIHPSLAFFLCLNVILKPICLCS